ncbi:MAG: hypothetical protein M1828_007574 [Chrysothrix sp. TS-e1954]|nr:MAG: hypothetical protein M1828_007574 [Chrysothrix sp. TS-e1954]
MHSSTFYTAFLFLIYPTLITLPALYLYPILFGCAFPEPARPQPACIFDREAAQVPAPARKVAPFRLLAFGDPQLEGDSSLPDPNKPNFPSAEKLRDLHIREPQSHWRDNAEIVKDAATELVLTDLPRIFNAWRKRVDLLGNDYYLAHIYRATHWWLDPTHVSVLGDLLGSQWISDEEFEKRGRRFWNRVFRKGQRVEDHLTSNGVKEVIGKDAQWRRRIINIAGNHDVGYAGDMTRHRLERFERVFGRANYEIRFQLPEAISNSSESASMGVFGNTPPELRIVVLNSMNMDAPALDTDLQSETYNFLNEDVINHSNPVEDRRSGTIVLTHIPLNKPEGVCVDGPHFAYHDAGVIREQNHLSQGASRNILEAMLGMSADKQTTFQGRGRKSIILTGHDHEGCRVYHYLPKDAGQDDDGRWQAVHRSLAQPMIDDADITGTEEVTLRSMMGSYRGNTGLLSAWYDDEVGEWQFEFDTCPFVVQHIWWAIHVLALVTVLVGFSGVLFEARELIAGRSETGHNENAPKSEQEVLKPSRKDRASDKANGKEGGKEANGKRPEPRKSKR